ncbi:MAG: NAD(P)H-dependent oxidoreductase subunit E, partial [Verrucomicrobiae bacterium]|nr:NAD(P)H-dependent oxidoreductase subunit E [Verrucomicrobiae bacterium]
MNATLLTPQKKRLQSVLGHASGDKRFKILEAPMKRHQFRHDALIEV